MTEHGVALLVDESDERRLELVAFALASRPKRVVVIAAARRLGFTTD